MEKSKFENEMKSLIKIGLPENMAYLIASHKYGKNKEEVEYALNEVKEQFSEIAESVKDFKPLCETLNLNLNNNNNNDKN
jgi:hypothetical protein